MSDISGIIFNIQRYSIHDGPGIRTTVFLKGCPLKCFWCQNPESQARKPEILTKKEVCTACGRCVDVCPNKASIFSDGAVIILRDECTGCGKCVDACPSEARSLIGKQVTDDEVLQEVLKDKKFYANSGGGVTLSGGEPTFQPEFALSILQKCKEAGLHTAIETCGYTSWDKMQEILKYTDFVLYDIKCIDAAKHKKGTGKDNSLIISNAKEIARIKPMKIRVPLIPGFNANAEEIALIGRFAKKELNITDFELLTYNKFGESKYERLGRTAVILPEIDEKTKAELDNVLLNC